MKGIVITTADEVSVQEFTAPLHKSLGAVVGGYIELVHPQGLNRPYCMVVNEEGLIHKLPLNRAGSLLYGTQFHGSPIVGDIVIMAEGETEEGFDFVGIPDDRIEVIKKELIKAFELKGASYDCNA